MPTINFFLQSTKELAGIYVRLREGAKIDAKAKTKFAVKQKDWSVSKGQPMLKDEGAKKLNSELSKFKSKLLDHYNNCVDKEPINSEWLKKFISPPINTEIPNLLIRYIEFFTSNQKRSVASSSLKRNNVYKAYIERFEKDSRKEFFVSDFGPDFRLKFEDYGEKNGYAHNTTARTIKFIKTVCRDARKKGIETHNLLDEVKVKLVKVDKIFLDFDELRQIEKVKLELESLDNARDWLLISCETGQRVSDFLQFDKNCLRKEKEVTLIEFTQKKTNQVMTIPVSKRVQRILKKRKGEFPRQISDVKYNVYIKEVCEKAGLTKKIKGSKKNPKNNRKESGLFPKWELVTSHIGRRSFATNYFGIIPNSLLMNATGHSTERMFLEYIGKTKTDQAMQLAQYIV